MPTDWNEYDFPTRQYARFWRQAEREVADLRQHRMQAFLRAWMKEK